MESRLLGKIAQSIDEVCHICECEDMYCLFLPSDQAKLFVFLAFAC